MPVNLVSLVMRYMTPENLGRIASLLGHDRSSTQAAITAAVPSLLAGFSGVAAQAGGPQKLANAAAQQAGALDGFAGMLNAGSQSSFIDQGSQMLSSLLGDRDQNLLAAAISRFAGMGQGEIGSLLGLLAPLVMGTIAQQQGATRVPDPSKIAGLLASQKDNIAAALPSGLASMLSGTGLLDSLGGAARTATAAGGEAARASASAARDIVDRGRRAATPASNNWLYWLIPAAAVAALLVYFAMPAGERVPDLGTTATTTTGQGTQQTTTPRPADVKTAMVGGVDVDKEVIDGIGTLRSALAGVTDSASAQAALPRIQEAATEIGKVTDVSGQLSSEQRRQIAGLVTPAMPALNQMFDKVLALPGLSSDVTAIVESLKAKLATLAA